MGKIKKGLFLFLFITISILLCYINSTDLFMNYQGRREVYLGSNSSSASVIFVREGSSKKYFSKKGEAVFIEGNTLAIEDIIKDFKAEIVFLEETDEGVSYYAYSRDIKYRKILNGKRVNLHVFQGKRGIKIGSPIIYGSF